MDGRDPEEARAQIVAAFPELRPQTVTYLAEGCDFRMFEVDSTWLFRFPKREQEIERLQREIALTDRLHGRLPVEIPHFTHRAADLAAYRRLDGLAMVGERPTPAFATSLAEFTSALHAIDPTGLSLPGEIGAAGMDGLRDPVAEGLVASKALLDPDVYARCEELLALPLPPTASRPCLIHYDIYPAHVLLRPDGAIRGVLDWGDAIVGDPATDFAVAYFWGGEEYLQMAIDGYSRDAGPVFEQRARVGGAYMAVNHLTYGARTHADEYVHGAAASLERMRAL